MMKTFSRILVPVDFSLHSNMALQYAASIGERFFSTLLILHVIAKEVEIRATGQQLGHRSIPLLGPFAETFEAPGAVSNTVVVDLHERARVALQEFIPPECSGLSVTLHVTIGHPVEQIVEYAASHHVDLIVMGTHGRTGLSHTLMGSVAERIVRLATRPVLTVKESEGA